MKHDKAGQEELNEEFVDLDSSMPVDDEAIARERFAIDLMGLFSAGLSGAFFTAFGFRTCSQDVFLEGAVIVAVICALLFLLAAHMNDFLTSSRGFTALIVISSFGICFGPVLLMASSLFFILIVVGYVALLFFWVSFLTKQTHYFLNIALLITFLLIGLALLFSVAIASIPVIALTAAVFGAISILAAYISKTRYKSNVTAFLSHEESRNNMRTRKSNFSKTFAEGLVFAVSLILFSISLEQMQLDVLFIGIVVIAAAIVSCLCRYIPNLGYENYMNWHMVLFYTVLFLIFPLGSDFIKLITSGLAFFISVCFILILIAAMAEFAKTVRISCDYEFGKEGGYFFTGVSFGLIVLLFAEHALIFTSPFVVNTVVCGVAIIMLAWLNIDIVKGGYPNPEEFGTAKERRMAPRHGTSWTARVNAVAKEYGLSPRQQEVLVLLARGRNTSYIMNDLCVSTATVKSHIYSVYRKLGVHTQQELIDMIEDYEIK